jgi:peptidoglycan/LPS O-acetylase OafA/YrhL
LSDTGQAAAPTRLDYLDGLRGLAACQVVLDHSLRALAPHFARETYLGHALSDGGVAVDIFFLLSGVVLTFAFQRRPRAVASGIIRRLIRLGVPILVACLLAVPLRDAGLDALREVAGGQEPANWLASHAIVFSFERALQDATVWTVLGLSDTTLFGGIAHYLPVQDSVADFPIWSLHIELWGSVLMLLVVAARSFGPWFYRAVLVAALLACGPFPIALFLLGHICAPLARRGLAAPRLGALALLAGLIIPAFDYIPGQYRIATLLGHTALLTPHSFFKLTAEVAAVLLCAGVLLTPAARRVLRAPPVLWLGRQSFGIYLLHVPILFSLGMQAYVWGGLGAALAATFATTLVAAAVFERLVDRPAIAWSHAFGRRPATAVTLGPVEPLA